MVLYSFLLCIAIATLMTFDSWRRGIFCLIVIAALQDPVRKMVPGAPGYLVLSVIPVWLSLVFRTIPFYAEYWQSLSGHFSQLSLSVRFFILSLIPASLISATYGPGSWQITVVGLISYSSLLLGVLLGYMHPKGDDRSLRQILSFYCIVTAIMLIGTSLEYLGMYKGWKALGSSAMGATWIQTSVHGTIVRMISGFYRSPDVMGWHSVMLSMFSVLLALKSKGTQRFLWLLLAGWGCVGGMLCGRRKMMYMLPVFGFVLFWLFWRIQNNRFQFKNIIVIVCFAVLAGYGIYHLVGPSADVEKYYFTNAANPLERFESHGFNALITTYRQSGFWGEGLGTATQGIHHLRVAKPRTWQEGGLGRILVELGVPGFICFILLVGALAKSLWHLIDRQLDFSLDDSVLRGGLFAVMGANAGSFVVSHQIFGDPFVIIFFAFLCGLILSGARTGESMPPVKHAI